MTDFATRGDVKLHRLDPWYRGPMVGFDLETTCKDPEKARIVGAAVVVVQAGKPNNGTTSWVVDPGVPIEPEATEVHGYTDAYVQQVGLRPSVVVPEIVAQLRAAWSRYWPVVIYNAPFDLTVLDRELRRLDIPDQADQHGATYLRLRDIGPVVDPLVLDKLVDRFRKGSRKLADVAEHYKADHLIGLHGAEKDAMATVRVAWKLGHRHPKVGTMSLERLGKLQVAAKRQQAESLDAYFRKTGNPEAGHVDGSWPIRPWVAPAAPKQITGCPECGAGCELDHDRHSCGWCPECHPEVPEWTTS